MLFYIYISFIFSFRFARTIHVTIKRIFQSGSIVVCYWNEHVSWPGWNQTVPHTDFPVIQFNERLVEMILDRLFPPVSLKSFAMFAGLATFRQGHVSSSASELLHVRTSSRWSQTLKITGNKIRTRVTACRTERMHVLVLNMSGIMSCQEGCYRKMVAKRPWQLTFRPSSEIFMENYHLFCFLSCKQKCKTLVYLFSYYFIYLAKNVLLKVNRKKLINDKDLFFGHRQNFCIFNFILFVSVNLDI